MTVVGQSFFVTGTDTGVGKTVFAAALLRRAREEGISTLGLKPVSAGCVIEEGARINEDVRLLREAASMKLPYARLNPLALMPAIAPHIAAAEEGIEVSAAKLAAHCRAEAARADYTVIEGAGGWRVPLNERETMADLAAELGCPVVLVVGMRLGCLNHALLTAADIAASGLRLAGWVANCLPPGMERLEANIAALEARLPAPLLATLPQGDPRDAARHITQMPHPF